MIDLVSIGLECYVDANRVQEAFVGTPPSRIRKFLQAAKRSGLVIDARKGRQTNSVIIMTTGHVILGGGK